MCAILFNVFNGCATSIKEINRSIWKGISNIYYWEKLTSKLRLSRKENLKKCTNFEEQKGTRYIRGNVYIGIIVFSCLSSTKPCLRFLLICFDQEIEGFYESSFGNEVDFTDVMNVSPNNLAKNQKLWHGFVDKRAIITTALTSSCHGKTLVPFCLRKERPENAFLTLTVNYRKIVQKNKLFHPKQH